MDVHQLRNSNRVLFQCISGSRSYGLDLPTSDTDIKGVYMLPKEELFSLHTSEQISNESNDIVFYELKRFFELLLRNNPNLLELLAVPDNCILYKHPLMERIQPKLFLSKLCQQTFANYAISQIKKAKGLNKKINKPHEEERKSILHFCYVTSGGSSLPLLSWLEKNQLQQEQCGLVALNHMRDLYALYASTENNFIFNGIVSKENSNEVTLSSVPKGALPLCYLYFNKDGYSVYCKEYRAYWEWVEKRNEARYQNTLTHGKNYDAKNMMHVFRLLNMAEEIALGRGIITKRPDREALLQIRSGAYEYEQLVQQAEEKLERIQELYKKADLPDQPDERKINALLIELRTEFYENK